MQYAMVNQSNVKTSHQKYMASLQIEICRYER
jgi:hypothetical protein